MNASSRKPYFVLLGLCLAGYTWLAYNVFTIASEAAPSVDACFIKQVSGIPCPSCGTTRSILALLSGDIANALWLNPLGLLAAVALITIPIWAFYDLVLRKSTLMRFYVKAESFIRRPVVAIPLILLVVLNWIWNITKGF